MALRTTELRHPTGDVWYSLILELTNRTTTISSLNKQSTPADGGPPGNGGTLVTEGTPAGGGTAPRLTFGTKLIFGSGAVGEAVYLGLFNTFITIYYNQAVGLANTLIGIAIMLAMIGDAVTDPLVGIMSDRWRSKHGRRHPFLFVAPVPLVLALYCASIHPMRL